MSIYGVCSTLFFYLTYSFYNTIFLPVCYWNIQFEKNAETFIQILLFYICKFFCLRWRNLCSIPFKIIHFSVFETNFVKVAYYNNDFKISLNSFRREYSNMLKGKLMCYSVNSGQLGHQIVFLKYIQFLVVNYTSKKLRGTKEENIRALSLSALHLVRIQGEEETRRAPPPDTWSTSTLIDPDQCCCEGLTSIIS